MISESWYYKKDLLKHIQLLKLYNTEIHFANEDEVTRIEIEKIIFYSAFIIRKLIDCKLKLSNTAEKYSLKVTSYKSLKKHDEWHNWIKDDSHDWESEKKTTIQGKNLCNSLIHSLFFSLVFDEEGCECIGFLVSSDYDDNNDELLYKVDLSEWIKYMNFIANDNVVNIKSDLKIIKDKDGYEKKKWTHLKYRHDDPEWEEKLMELSSEFEVLHSSTSTNPPAE